MLTPLVTSLVVVCLVAVPLYAQTPPKAPRAFVDGHFGPNWDDAISDSTFVPGATIGAGVAFGFDSEGSGIELGVTLPQWHEKNPAPLRYQYVGRSFGYHQQGHFYESSSTVRRRSIDVTVLYRANVPLNRHATLTWLAGGGYVFRPEQFTSITKEVLPDGQLTHVNTSRSTSFRNYLAAAARIDVELKIASQVSIVPQLRVTAFPSIVDDSGLAPRLLVARPDIAVRWSF